MPGHLSSRCVHVPGPAPSAETIAADAGSPTSLLVARFDGRRTNVERVTTTGASTHVLSLGASLPVAIDRAGAQILYLIGHSPPALWKATIAGSRPAHARRLIANSQLGAAAW